ncbi:maleylacetoacetate isomerase [Burkholderia plantarii]|uniref:maleylacetoacetate isomerase n=1 Tax=Burkholderia plantarii TaxID=41899 RepID=UPI0009F307EA|nr:maleylacetoacetate isomerase [Burkholderia plantarii]
MQLYSFFKSTASFRVRIVLALKGIDYRTESINLLDGGGANHDAAFVAINPQRLLPVLVTEHGDRLTQSIAICEYLEERYPAPPLLPPTPERRAHVRALMAIAACDTHPLHTTRVTRHLAREFGADEAGQKAWARHWLHEGLVALDQAIGRAGRAGTYCDGEQPSLADAFLVPQFASALACDVDTGSLRFVPRIARACLNHPAFQAALPQRQPDAGPDMALARQAPVPRTSGVSVSVPSTDPASTASR